MEAPKAEVAKSEVPDKGPKEVAEQDKNKLLDKTKEELEKKLSTKNS